ncbi:hypothetical protein DdX_15907 [Ditylenchus destructor]|uniref:Thioredoxin domain-containing protein n=1 Tax=Ditylenchus destructor TaxID=166010 RepID=A0AAD4MRX6_9BILA|nr:hypothetical protein DdX_15907 [Ditylenchus destructor]
MIAKNFSIWSINSLVILILSWQFPTHHSFLFSSRPIEYLTPEPTQPTCPAFNYFDFYWRKQCPAEVGKDLKCVVGLPGDVHSTGVLNCGTVEPYSFPHIQVLNATEMLEALRHRDEYGRPWCMLSLLYSPNCVFSAKIASTFHQVAPMFPKLRVVAVDVSAGGKHTEQLIAQFGIASTPVIALWENGYPRFKLHDDYSQLDSLIETIHLKTDLRSENISNIPVELSDDALTEPDGNTTLTIEFVKKHPTEKEFLAQFYYLQEELGFDWYFLAALVTMCFNVVYYVHNSDHAKEYIRLWLAGILERR